MCVAVVRDVVHRRHVDARDLRQLSQHRLAIGAAGGLPRTEHLGDLGDDFFALAQYGGVDEIGEWLGIECGMAADHHEQIVGAAIGGVQRSTSQIDHVEHVGEHELARQVEGEDVEVGGGAVGIDAEQRNAGSPQLPIQIGPGGIRALGERIGAFVQDFVEDLEPLVGQTDLVGIGVSEEPGHRVPVVELVVAGSDGTVFAADVTSWFLHPGQKRFDPRPEC